MLCPNCKHEIEGESKFCPYCGEDLTKVEEVKEDVVTQEVTKKERKRRTVSEKTMKLYKCIFVMIISLITFVVPFGSMTSSSVFKESNLITFFVNCNFSSLDVVYGTSLATQYYVLGIIGYILTIVIMGLCLVNLVFSIISLILNIKYKLMDIFIAIIFTLALFNFTIIGFTGASSVITIFLAVCYAIGLFIMKMVSSSYQAAIKIVYSIGFGFFLIGFISIISVHIENYYSFQGIQIYLSRIDKEMYGDFLAPCISQLILYIALMLVVIFSIGYVLFLNRRLVAPIGGFVVFFISIIFTITLNLTSTTIVQSYIGPCIVYILSSILLLVVDLILIKKEKEITQK